MTLDDTQKQKIRQQFDQIQTKTDLLNLLNYVKPLAFAENTRTRSGKAKEFQLKSLTWYANTSLSVERYKTFSIPKRNGNPRIIHAPTDKLKYLQRCLNALLHCLFKPQEAAMGFVVGKSVVYNAQPHVGKPYVYNVDLKDFFTSIEFHRVKACLKLPPFNLIGTREPLAFLIANLCCVRDPSQPNRAFLPQGAPTSPLLTNVVCQRLDKLLSGLAKRFGATYTRYADDLTFSSYTNIYETGGEFCHELERIVTNQNFIINPAKTRLQRSGYQQQVTGLTVNQTVNVSQKYLREVRQLLHLWKQYGEVIAQKRYWDSRNVNFPSAPKPALKSVLRGKLLYLKMVRGVNDKLFQKYDLLYKELTGILPIISIRPSIENIVPNIESPITIEKRAENLLQVIDLYKSGDTIKAVEMLSAYKKARQLDDGRR